MSFPPGRPAATLGGTATANLRAGQLDDEMVSTLALIRGKSVPAMKLTPVLDHLGSAVELACIALAGGGDAGSIHVKPIDRSAIDAAWRDFQEWRRRGYYMASFISPQYPARLHEVFDAPPMLFAEGDTGLLAERQPGLAIVGTRKATDQGRKRAFQLAKELADAEIIIFSGLAEGIDISAHTGAVKAGGRTVAVMGTGLGVIFPAHHRTIAREIVERHGALVSQFMPGSRGARWTFPLRNVTMSGLTYATVVIEAGESSGAKMQAEAALRHGRQVFLPRSLVQGFKWAERMVAEGLHGVRAIQIDSPESLIDMYRLRPEALLVGL